MSTIEAQTFTLAAIPDLVRQQRIPIFTPVGTDEKPATWLTIVPTHGIEPDSRSHWQQEDTGIVVLTKDGTKIPADIYSLSAIQAEVAREGIEELLKISQQP